jgi:hypothetical protein
MLDAYHAFFIPRVTQPAAAEAALRDEDLVAY